MELFSPERGRLIFPLYIESGPAVTTAIVIGPGSQECTERISKKGHPFGNAGSYSNPLRFNPCSRMAAKYSRLAAAGGAVADLDSL